MSALDKCIDKVRGGGGIKAPPLFGQNFTHEVNGLCKDFFITYPTSRVSLKRVLS